MHPACRIACPKCGASRNTPCTRMVDSFARSHTHRARVEKAGGRY